MREHEGSRHNVDHVAELPANGPGIFDIVGLPCLVPPKNDEICLVHLNGVSNAHAHPTAMGIFYAIPAATPLAPNGPPAAAAATSGSYAGQPRRLGIDRLRMQPFLVKYLFSSWYIETQPIITVDFESGTSTVFLNFTIGRLMSRRKNINIQTDIYADWTSAPRYNWDLCTSISHLFRTPLRKDPMLWLKCPKSKTEIN